MKRILVICSVVAAIILLIVFNKMTSKRGENNSFTEVKKGLFEISVTNSGELVAEKIGSIKENISIRRFSRFKMGEGLEKKTDDFAAEVASMVG